MRFELSDVTAGYGDTVVLRNLDLVVPTGTIAAVLGPNGAGKTTMLRVASGLLHPIGGRVLIDGIDMTGRGAEAMTNRGVCHVTEGRAIFGGLTVRENLRMFSARSSCPFDEAVDRAVAAFPMLGSRLAQLAGTMSGGQQQMLALSRAYVTQAPLVMLDEVSMGLAPIVVDEIFAFLERLLDQGQSILLVEQYVAKALSIASLAYILVRGRCVFRGEPSELAGTDIAERYLGEHAGTG
jgi:branched-chain amino acid transport system ATP-binding protein